MQTVAKSIQRFRREAGQSQEDLALWPPAAGWYRSALFFPVPAGVLLFLGLNR